jgi:CheY-like chemotaxis protein
MGNMHDAAQQSEALVLVVEDESLMRMHAVIMIEEAGYNVVEACNADEAIAILESRERHPRRCYGYRNAGIDGWNQTRAGHPRSVAPSRAYRHLRSISGPQ